MFTNQETESPKAAADTAPAPALTPEAVVEALRAVRAQIGEVTPLTQEQRRLARSHAQTPAPVLQASINTIGVSELVSQVVGTPAAQVRELNEEANRWTAVEDELRLILKGVVGANLIRRERVAVLAAEAARVSVQLAKKPEHVVLVPHVEEIKRLKSVSRRKKAAQAPEKPASPATGTTKP